MKIAEMAWSQVEDHLTRSDLCVVPLGSTEQHAGLSLSVDSILAERVAVEAAEPLGVPVFPVLPYGVTPYFAAYPGTVSLRVETYVAVVRDVLDALHRQGFRRMVLVNGHGGNAPAGAFAVEWMGDRPGTQVKFHNWWSGPRTWAHVQAIDPEASHASWMESFPWTRLPGPVPTQRKPMVDTERMRSLGPEATRALLGDGSFGGLYGRPDEEMLALWATGVEETRAVIEGGWA